MSLSTLATGLDHAEGVAWHPDGYLVAGGEAGQLYRITPSEGPEPAEPELVADTGGFCLGIALSRSHAFVCDMARSAVLRVGLSDGAVEPYSRGIADRPMRVPNFAVFDRDGRLWVSDSGGWGADDGLVWVVEADGETAVASEEASAFTNGMAISPDGDYLYVVESGRPCVTRLPMSGRELGPAEFVCEMPQTVPDGLAFASDGTLLISCYRPDRIYRFSDGRGLEVMVDDWTGLTLNAPTNLAFFGPELSQLVTANLAGRHLTEVQTGLNGAPLHLPEAA